MSLLVGNDSDQSGSQHSDGDEGFDESTISPALLAKLKKVKIEEKNFWGVNYQNCIGICHSIELVDKIGLFKASLA